MNKKPLSFRSTLHFVQQQNHSKFFHAFHFALQNSLQLIKKKDFSITPLRVVRKDSAPIQFKFFELLKNQEHRNIATLSLQLRSYKKYPEIFETWRYPETLKFTPKN